MCGSSLVLQADLQVRSEVVVCSNSNMQQHLCNQPTKENLPFNLFLFPLPCQGILPSFRPITVRRLGRRMRVEIDLFSSTYLYSLCQRLLPWGE
uniref:Uncharacterized protein n=1 Tax=Utricularia reniformis TaxID=192314 RepID=A0A1Y0AZ73_9LAMI|nr:hypothetical protein AEK19_MT2209 [Utricularia reniformis]ART30440.1 hypothetical protein AEK19_MT2209 [Utricularia reniformis]